MSFQKVRDELIYCFANGILDEEEFVLLYDAYKSIESQRRKLFQLLESCWSCWPGYLIGKGLVSRNNMAAAKAILQELYFRGIDPLKYVLSHRYGWRFCSSVSSNGNQLQGDTREETEGESPAGKMLALVVSSLRVDRVLSSGLGMGRSKAGDLIAARHLYLNQKICQKASLQVNEGDEIDITKSKENSVVELSRFKVLTIDKNHTKKNKRRLSGVRFARIFMPREEFDKKYKSSD